jgi:hypothetical protein
MSRFDHKFLHTKGFHPANVTNQKEVWMAEQKALSAKKDAEQRVVQLKEERSADELAKAAGRVSGAMAFMYKPPPGLKEAEERMVEKQKQAEAKAAREKDLQKMQQAGIANRLDLDTSFRKPVTEAELREFHGLGKAPLVGEYAKDMSVTIKPFNKLMRNIRCAKCGQPGHQAIDRECPLFDAKSAEDQQRSERLDPMARADAQVRVLRCMRHVRV